MEEHDFLSWATLAAQSSEEGGGGEDDEEWRGIEGGCAPAAERPRFKTRSEAPILRQRAPLSRPSRVQPRRLRAHARVHERPAASGCAARARRAGRKMEGKTRGGNSAAAAPGRPDPVPMDAAPASATAQRTGNARRCPYPPPHPAIELTGSRAARGQQRDAEQGGGVAGRAHGGCGGGGGWWRQERVSDGARGAESATAGATLSPPPPQLHPMPSLARGRAGLSEQASGRAGGRR